MDFNYFIILTGECIIGTTLCCTQYVIGGRENDQSNCWFFLAVNLKPGLLKLGEVENVKSWGKCVRI